MLLLTLFDYSTHFSVSLVIHVWCILFYQILASLPPLRQKRRLFFVTLYGVMGPDEYKMLKVTQETTTLEAIQQVGFYLKMFFSLIYFLS